MHDEDKHPLSAGNRESAPADQPAIVGRSQQQVKRRTPELERVERDLEAMKLDSEILLESTRHYVQPDPEDFDSVYDTCDVLGPWDSLDASERRAALEELNWRGVSPDDKQRIVDRELGDTPPLRAREDADMPRIADQQASYRATPNDKSRDR